MDLILYVSIGILVYVYAVISGFVMRELTDDPYYDLTGWRHILFVVFMSILGGASVLYYLVIKCLNWLNTTFQLRFWYQWYFTSHWDNLSEQEIRNVTKYINAYLNNCNGKPPFFWRQTTKLIISKYNLKITLE